jgi:hypothetical protein
MFRWRFPPFSSRYSKKSISGLSFLFHEYRTATESRHLFYTSPFRRFLIHDLSLCSLLGPTCVRQGSRDGASPFEGALWREPGGRAPLLGTPKNMQSKTLEMGACFHRGPAFAEHAGRSFPRAFERREKFISLQKFLWGIWEVCKKGLVKRLFSP